MSAGEGTPKPTRLFEEHEMVIPGLSGEAAFFTGNYLVFCLKHAINAPDWEEFGDLLLARIEEGGTPRDPDQKFALEFEIELRSAKFVRQEFPIPTGLPNELYPQIMEIFRRCVAAHPSPAPTLALPGAETLLVEVERMVANSPEQDGPLHETLRKWIGHKRGTVPFIPSPAPTATKQQRLSKKCEECAEQIEVAVNVAGGEVESPAIADLIYQYMRDFLHEEAEVHHGK